ncbi:hypothetical protein NliqN6_6804 [Naganishia liquefaciens]|uniref:Glycosyl transferase CAP10 domain-containing protein n=1 Tax=Naganishia liquefaciens TaxID=104408 RepID=A0A8H3YJQ4_9TREE|nr:hypothetical protein NliqN6_6804 [Naganishia liquefaciens]
MPRTVAKTSPTKKVVYAAGGLLAILTLLHFLFNSSEDAALRNAKWTAVPTSFRQKLLSSRTSKAKQRPPIVHPIPAKMKQAQENFETKLARQSKTLSQAVAEYKKRYNMDPPKGFDEWFQFAKDNKVDIIDEYDQLMKDLDPWYQLSGEEIRRRCIQVGYLPSVDLVRVENGTTHTIDVNRGFDDSEVGARAKGFRVMLEKFQDKLPNMDFPINEKAEGRILVPWEQRLYSNLTADTTKGIEHVLGGKFIPDWKGDGNVWESFRRTCDPHSQARRLFSSKRHMLKEGQQPFSALAEAGIDQSLSADFIFNEGTDDKYDFCSHPWAHYKQGHFFSDWRTIEALYPMFSPAKGIGYSDILIPSHYYYSSTKRYTYGWDPENMIIKEVDDMEMPWSKKIDDIFWRGATTGGGSNPPGFLPQYQRHRFIKMTSDTSNVTKDVVFADPPGSDHWIEAPVPLGDLNADIMDVAFTKAVGCTQYPGGCDGMRKDHRFADTVPLGENWRHKYLIDLDGMGYSARLFSLLASESAVMKTTVYTEFFSDWIEPWLHYIPVSLDYQEIYNIWSFFSGPTVAMQHAANITRNLFGGKRAAAHAQAFDGDAELRKIAKAGRHWKFTHGRKVDMEVYVYRLCLEWGRLNADDREAMSFKA